MIRIRSCLLVGQIFVLAAAGCAAPVEGGEELAPEGAIGGKADAVDRVVTQDDNGATIEVTEGTPIVLRLPSNPTTGYGWEVVSTDRTFGYPEESFEASRTTLIGAGGTAVFRWETSGGLSQVGEHSVRLEYKRSWEEGVEPADTFELNIVVTESTRPDAVVVTESQNGATVDVEEGKQVQLRLPSNPSTGYGWYVTRTDRSFGYPETGFESTAPEGIVGAGGTATFTWETAGALPLLGAHRVELKYSRGPRGRASRTFRFTANVIPAAPDALNIEVSEENNNGTFSATVGQPVVVRVAESAFHRISWRVLSTDRTFGYPTETFEAPPPGLLDGPTYKIMTWRTDGFLSQVGSHTVVLENSNGLTGETSTFTFTVDVSE